MSDEPKLPREADDSVGLHREHHDVSLALLAATLFPGGGQLYNEQRGKALLLFVLFLAMLALFVADPNRPGRMLLCGLVCFVDWVLGLVDAGLVAGRLIRGQRVRPWQWM